MDDQYMFALTSRIPYLYYQPPYFLGTLNCLGEQDKVSSSAVPTRLSVRFFMDSFY